MEQGLLLILFGISFLSTLVSLPGWIRRARNTGFVGRDLHKKDEKKVAEMGGVTVIFGTVLATLLYIALETFYYTNGSMTFLLAALSSILIATMIGMVDDMLGWRIGLTQKEKVFLTFLVPIPIMVINAGYSMMTFPILGKVELGLLYPLLIVPVGIIGATNGFNMLAGYNNLEAGMGVIIFSTLSYLSWQTGAAHASFLAASFVFAILAFLVFNRYPSKVFPGDAFTYPAGAGIAIIAILADIERFAFMLFALYYLEFLLKARGRFRPEWSARVMDDSSLAVRSKIYSVPHIAITIIRKIKGSAYEYEVVSSVLAVQIVISIITIGVFMRWF